MGHKTYIIIFLLILKYCNYGRAVKFKKQSSSNPMGPGTFFHPGVDIINVNVGIDDESMKYIQHTENTEVNHYSHDIKRRDMKGAEKDLSMSMKGATCPERRDMQQIALARDPNLVTPLKWKCKQDGKFKRFMCGTFLCYCVHPISGKIKYPSAGPDECRPDLDKCDSICTKKRKLRRKRLSALPQIEGACTKFTRPLCASDLNFYDDLCEFRCAECKAERNFTVIDVKLCEKELKSRGLSGELQGEPPCWRDRRSQKTLNRHRTSGSDGKLRIYKCDKDGFYQTKQCSKGACTCVDRVTADFTPKLDPNHHCKVQRADQDSTLNMTGETCEMRQKKQRLEMVSNMEVEIIVIWDCDKDGKYLPQLCGGGICFCVNPDNGEIDWDTEGASKQKCESKVWPKSTPSPHATFPQFGAGAIFRIDEDICFLPPRTGECRASLLAWYYDKTLEECKVFVYGGCNSNGNNFHTQDECMEKCAKFTPAPKTEEEVTTATTAARPIEFAMPESITCLERKAKQLYYTRKAKKKKQIINSVTFWQCTNTGLYQHRQCGFLGCHCVDIMGNFIEGISHCSEEEGNNGVQSRRVGEKFCHYKQRVQQSYIHNSIANGYMRPIVLILWKCHLSGVHFTIQCGYLGCRCVDKQGVIVEGSTACFGKRKCQRMKQKQIEYRNRARKLGVGNQVLFRWECQRNGKYKAIQCGPVGCHCVDIHSGRVIEGLKPKKESDCKDKGLLCKNRLKLWRVAKKYKYTGIVKWRCKHDGSYFIHQCNGRKCYCVHPVTGAFNANKQVRNKRNCRARYFSMKRKKRAPSPLCQQCIEKRRNKNMRLMSKEFKLKKYTCDAAGFFDRKQCNKGICKCYEPTTGQPMHKLDPSKNCLVRKKKMNTN